MWIRSTECARDLFPFWNDTTSLCWHSAEGTSVLASEEFYRIIKKMLLFFIFSLSLNAVFGEEVSVLEGNVVSFKTGVTDIRKLYLIWLYRDGIIAKMNEGNINLYDTDDGIFEDRLQLDNQTGSLTISDIRTKHAGPYQLKIITNETFIKTFSLTVQDVFFAGVENKREGDSVTLNTGVTEIKKHNLMMWMFGPSNPDVRLVEIIINHNISYDFDERYRDRLHVDHQTGSLTIKDLKTTNTGVYQLQISNIKETIYKRYNVFVAAAEPELSTSYTGLICAAVLLPILGAIILVVAIGYRRKYSHLKDKMKTVSVMEGNSAILKTGITEIQDHHKIIWRFGAKGPIIAQVHKKTYNVPYTDDERFRNKLHLDKRTGDLTINDVRIRISGDYHREITRRNKITKSKRFRVVVRVDTIKVTEGESVDLQTGISELQDDDQIQWRSEAKDAIIAVRNGKTDKNMTLNHQTGSLTIKNIENSHSGVYELQIKNKNTTSYKKFNVLVWFNTLKHTAGDSVTLQTGVSKLKKDHQMLWTFGNKNTRIAEINRASGKMSVYDGNDERFRDRLTLNEQNGDLTITNISRGHSDVYKLQINSSSDSTYRRFMIIVNEKLESVMEGESVTLHTDLTDMQSDDVMILWMFGPENNLIAKADSKKRNVLFFNVVDENKMLYDGADGRFKDKLELDQTGSLTIKNINSKHRGLYKLLIISNKETKFKKYRVSFRGNRERAGAADHIEEVSEGIPLIPIQTSQQ
ncbi:uncharacterized protein [Misgurnus anguillicaudatus]|uniref:uncharacterized protein isoform X2 n=1 Tax=Misgurnus anguillicaudatus TaxID=75329 RepID=UPI003CCF44FA